MLSVSKPSLLDPLLFTLQHPLSAKHKTTRFDLLTDREPLNLPLQPLQPVPKLPVCVTTQIGACIFKLELALGKLLRNSNGRRHRETFDGSA